MDPNNFEKNIQKKMGGLKIPPSNSVWGNVEKRIGKKKRDRRIIFILSFLVLFLMSGGYWIFNSTKNNSHPQNQQITNVLKKDSKATNNNNSSSTHSITPSRIIPGNAGLSKISEEKAQTQSIVVHVKKNEGDSKRSKKDISTKNDFLENDKAIALSQNVNKSNKKSIDSKRENNIVNQNNLAEKNTETDNVNKDNVNSDSNIIVENKIKADTSLKDKEEKLIAKKDSSTKKIVASQKHKWTFGFTFSGGKSMIGEGPLGVNNGDYAYAQSTPGPGSVNNPPFYLPSKIKGSVAFIGGIFMEKNISVRNKILFGISYKYFSLLNKVGNRVDTSITFPSLYLSASGSLYNSTNNVNSYRNNFHFLEIPVSIKLQLGNSKTLPLYWQAGVTISQLISSNALQFKSSPGLYYHDNSLFHKTQIGLQTGFSAILFSDTKNPLSIGPYFIYNTSKLTNDGLYSGKHFSFLGIKTEILFGKK
jgi:hypothetical protein